jgi:alpha/beta superfamily hydrolase
MIEKENTELPKFIDGPIGRLEYDFIRAAEAKKNHEYIAVVCHPHPQHGGTKDNKVVHTLCRAWRDMGIDCLRFNFRGVGKSEGDFDQGVGELEDLLAVIKFIRLELGESSQLIVSGFSFGAFIAARYASSNPVAALVLVAPPVSYPEFDTMNTFLSPVLLIQGDQDEVVSFAEVEAWSEGLVTSPVFKKLEGASHFFHGKLPELKSIAQAGVQAFLEN